MVEQRGHTIIGDRTIPQGNMFQRRLKFITENVYKFIVYIFTAVLAIFKKSETIEANKRKWVKKTFIHINFEVACEFEGAYDIVLISA